MGFDDLIKGATFLQGSLQQLAISNSVNDARERIAQINQQELDRSKALQASQQVANDLALRLAGSGANAATIEQTAGRLGITAPQETAQIADKERQGSQQEFTREENQKNRENQYAIASLGIEAAKESAGARMDQKQATFLKDYQKMFNQEARKIKSASNQAGLALEVLKAGNPIGDNAVGTFMARLSGEVGNLTEAEREMFKGSNATARKANSLVSKYKSGKISAADRADLIQLASVMTKANKRALDDVHSTVSKQAFKGLKAAGAKVNYKDVKEAIFEPSIDNEGTTDVPAGGMSAPEASGGSDDFMKYITNVGN
jgi:hypothetical protein